jgi:hypothetical protein
MPRYDRGVTQRYAARKRRKRAGVSRLEAPVAPPIGPETEEQEDSAVAAEVVAPWPPRQPEKAAPTRRSTPVVRVTTTRRPFSSYADEYRYVLNDLKRVVLVAGGLLLALIVLSFFLR